MIILGNLIALYISTSLLKWPGFMGYIIGTAVYYYHLGFHTL